MRLCDQSNIQHNIFNSIIVRSNFITHYYFLHQYMNTITKEISLQQRDKAVNWHPYTQMKTADDIIPIVKGKGIYLYDNEGKKYLDVVSSWWVTLHGHSHPYIAQRVFEQLNTLEQVIFAGFTHEPAVKLSENLLKLLPDGQEKVFYSDNGSTAVEVALKMCIQYAYNQDKKKTKILLIRQ